MTDGGIEKKMQTKFKIKLWTLISGVSGCFCFGGGDWLIPVCEGLMLPVFLYWFYLQITGNTIFKKGMAFTNVLVIFGILKGISMLMPESGFKLGFTNGLMSESMFIWFLLIFLEIGSRK